MLNSVIAEIFNLRVPNTEIACVNCMSVLTPTERGDVVYRLHAV